MSAMGRKQSITPLVPVLPGAPAGDDAGAAADTVTKIMAV